jgi:DNA-directed RNA polymerase alpha subunit
MHNVIDRTNRFYIEMSRKVLSKKEYDVLCKLLIEKTPLQEAGEQYGVTSEYVEELYERTLSKVKAVTELLSEIDRYEKKLQDLKRQLNPTPSTEEFRKDKTDPLRQKFLYNSDFTFSKRLQTILETLEIKTIGELSELTLKDFMCIRGFKAKCKEELIAFIEFENIEHLFDGFSRWKKEPIDRSP